MTFPYAPDLVIAAGLRFTMISVSSACRCAVLAAVLIFGAPKAQAQADLNIQSRVQTYTLPLTTGITEIQQPNYTNFGACLDSAVLVVHLARWNFIHLPPDPTRPKDQVGLPDNKNQLVSWFQKGAHKQEAADLLAQFFRTDANAESDLRRAVSYNPPAQRQKQAKAISPLQMFYCNPGNVIKLSAPFNPTVESNVLKNNQNNSFGTSWGYGGAVQAFTSAPSAAAQTFDVIGLSAQSASARYNQFPSKSFDSIITQMAYQHFLDGSGYTTDNRLIDISPDMPNKRDIPPTNMITVDSVAFGFQNQTVFLPGFHAETVDLFTPQVTLNRQNQDLSSNHASCFTAIPDPRQQGLCYYTDLAFTVGQTFSDVPSQQNFNLTFSATPGIRLNGTDWKLTLPMTETVRAYEDVLGGRDDLLLQIGPVIAYTPPTFTDRAGNAYALMFSVAATYNKNFSTLNTAAWQGYVIMPTLTVAFQPPPPVRTAR